MTQRLGLVVTVSFALALPVSAQLVPDEVPDIPFLAEGNRRGFGTAVDVPFPFSCGFSGIGRPTGYGGTAIFSCGEYIYQDHLFDAAGADDGEDADRVALLDPLAEAEPRTFKTDHAINYVVDELGAPVIPPWTGKQWYGDAAGAPIDVADLVEVGVAARFTGLRVRVKTTTMTTGDEAAFLILLDVDPDHPTAPVSIPFGSGLSSARADLAILAHGDSVAGVDLRDGSPLGGLFTSVDPSGYRNESRTTIAWSHFSGADAVRIAVASGRNDGGSFADLGTGGPNVANVAFRLDEPVLSYFEKRQALVLFTGSIDPFFAEIPGASLFGRHQAYVPAAGYHDRIFRSTETISLERSRDGVWQHYGLFLPSTYAGDVPHPLTMWLHFRGGRAHTAAAVVPRIFEDYGEEPGSIVVSPRGRGTSHWYNGPGHVDFLEVWADVHEHFTIDENRRYVSGHSMGGWGTYLMTVLYPDRFAAGMPVAGPIVQGAHLGCDEPFCNQLPQNDGRIQDQYTGKMLPNLRHVPLAIFHGGIDELVPVAGVTAQALRLARLGYPYRYYLFPNYEHYSHPIVDEWEEGVRYLHRFVRDPNPRCVTYIRDMPFEQAVEQVRVPRDANGDHVYDLDFDFDHAYWMRGLVAKEVPGTLESGDEGDLGVARFDGCSLAIADPATVLAPIAGGPAAPGQAGPYVMTGLDPVTPPVNPLVSGDVENGFEATLSGASAATLDLERMAIDPEGTIFGTVTTDEPLALTLDGDWPNGTTLHVEIDGEATDRSVSAGRLTLDLAPGTRELLVEQGT